MHWKVKEPLLLGWSDSKKFIAVDNDEQRYFVRESPLYRLETVRLEVELMRLAREANIPVPILHHWQIDDEKVTTVSDWLQGEMLRDVIAQYSEQEQYHLGQLAGQYLAKLHQLSLSSTSPFTDWEVFFNEKINRKILQYKTCGLYYEHEHDWLEVIDALRPLLKGRPIVAQHGDFHIANLMLVDHQLYVIDFNSAGWGDPWEEFNRLTWSAMASPAFASGLVSEYFNGDVPQIFWQCVKLYVVVDVVGSLPWASKQNNHEVEVMKARSRAIRQWYDDIQQIIPNWFQLRENDGEKEA